MAKLVYLPEAEWKENSVVTVGTFDGVHEGHKSLIQKVVAKAQNRGARSVVISFDPHPREILNSGNMQIRLLTSLEERSEILGDLGVDELIIIPFDRDFSLLTAEEFIRDIIHAKIGVSEFVIGYDHQFGRNREGTIETVQELGRNLGFDVHVVEAHEVDEITVSSTSVRNALANEGDVKLAWNFLGRPYKLTGYVSHGDKRGKQLGFPTANIQPDHPKKIIPFRGVYAVDVEIEGKTWRGMMNIGVRPTFDGSEQETLEVNLFDFDRDIYGMQLVVYFLERVRDEKKFNGKQELIEQLNVDKQRCLKVK